MNDIPRPRGRPPMNRDANPDAEQEPTVERASMRDDDPRARAAARAAALRDNRDESYDGTDEFYIDQTSIPDGWSYEWKTRFVLGQEQSSHMMAIRRGGWEEVPTKRHPEMMPVGSDEPFIMRKGQVLMERPAEITEDARRKERREARAQVQGKEDQLNSVEAGQFERRNKEESLVRVKKSYEAMPIPD